MSGYGEQPPGWYDPYGGSNGAPGWDGATSYRPGSPYGAPYGSPYGPPGAPQAPASHGSAVAALVCNCVAAALCCNVVAIPGIITGALALGRVQTAPSTARKLTIWSWSLFAASIVIGIIVGVVYIALMIAAEPDYTSTSGA